MVKKTKNKVVNTFSDSEFYFDDCAICRGMKVAEEKGKSLDADELKMLFKKANKIKKEKKL